jgi:isoleucyl-tRNA synthetase
MTNYNFKPLDGNYINNVLKSYSLEKNISDCNELFYKFLKLKNEEIENFVKSSLKILIPEIKDSYFKIDSLHIIKELMDKYNICCQQLDIQDLYIDNIKRNIWIIIKDNNVEFCKIF